MKTNYMSNHSIRLALLAGSLIALNAFAQPPEGGKPEGERRGPPPEMRERIKERFDRNEDGKLGPGERRAMQIAGEMRKDADKDGDGKLSEEERAAFREAVEARRAEMLKKFDTDGDGVLSEEERAEMQKARREEMKKVLLEKFDADGDGVLSDEERAKAREEMQKRREGNRPPRKGDGEGPGRRPGPPPEGE
jgi:Ca2+-binding EF-hand superfamily protein